MSNRAQHLEFGIWNVAGTPRNNWGNKVAVQWKILGILQELLEWTVDFLA